MPTNIIGQLCCHKAAGLPNFFAENKAALDAHITQYSQFDHFVTTAALNSSNLL